MSRRLKYNLILDAEFMRMKLPISEKSYASLEENIFDNGCLSPILLWENTIIDGYKRYEICKSWNLPYVTRHIYFSSRDDAISYICTDQLKRTDLSKEATSYLIGKLLEAEKAINTRHAAEMLNQSTERIRKPGRNTNYSYQTAIDLGKKYQISHNTVYKYGIYARCIDIVWEKEPDIIKKIFSGKLKISHQNVVELSRLPKGHIRTLNQHLSNDGIEHIGYSDMRHELQWKRISAATNPPPKKEKPPEHDFQIKKLPQYDPDAEIASLTLTIPSWIGTIQRVKENTDFSQITREARNKLLRQLHNMYEAVAPLIDQIREDNRNG